MKISRVLKIIFRNKSGKVSLAEKCGCDCNTESYSEYMKRKQDAEFEDLCWNVVLSPLYVIYGAYKGVSWGVKKISEYCSKNKQSSQDF